jgi:predicted RNA-binding protein associated with RNAse of E/G family
VRYRAGQVVVRRIMHPDGRIAAAQAGRVVADDDLGLRLWIEAGSAVMHRTRFDGTTTRQVPIREELTTPTTLAPATWTGHRTLMLMPPGAAHAVWWSWTPGGDFAGWYVNLEEPIRRWAGGFDVRDQALDLIIQPDGTPKWKDEDQFADQTGDPLFWDAAAATRIRAEGDRMLAVARTGGFPFDGTWRDFRPDPAWTATAMPSWWDVPAATDVPDPAR